MKKLLIVINSKMHIRNYISNHVFTHFPNYELAFLVEEEVSKHLPSDLKQIGTFKLDQQAIEKNIQYFDYLTWAFRDKSKSFRYRFKRMYLFGSVKGGLLKPLRLLKKYLKALKVILGGTFPFINIISTYYQKNLPLNSELKLNIEKYSPDLILFPSSAYDTIGNDILRIAKNKFKTLFVIDNWDNLTSKSIMWVKPDFLTVWSTQAKLHAQEVQSFNPDQIHIIGTSRFDVYYESKAEPIYDFRYIVFSGCNLGFDEISALKTLESEIENNKNIYGDIKIVYRPHPWRQKRDCFDDFIPKDYKHVVLDKQLEEVYLNKTISTNFQPDLNYYPRLLKNCLFTICPLSTMLLESLICKKDVLVIAYNDGIHETSPDSVYANYKHFEGIEKLQAVTFCDKKNNLSTDFRKSFLELKQVNDNRYSDVQYLVYSDDKTYNQRLNNVINKIIGEK